MHVGYVQIVYDVLCKIGDDCQNDFSLAKNEQVIASTCVFFDKIRPAHKMTDKSQNFISKLKKKKKKNIHLVHRISFKIYHM